MTKIKPKTSSKDRHWVLDYQLILLDFDGLLVNTEEIHYLAYKQMLAARGFSFTWDFNRYCQYAHYEADALRIQLYKEFPKLLAQEPNWDVLYSEKKSELQKLFVNGAVHLMPGVEHFLHMIKEAGIQRSVVTHSPDNLVALVRDQNPILNTIPSWITREHYSRPKPDSECYLYAIAKFAKPTDRVIGFEDTPRGIRALQGTRAQAVLICQAQYPEIPSFLNNGVKHFATFEHLTSNKLP